MDIQNILNIICKNKNRTVVEYALNDSHKPIGVATYQMRDTLPEKMKDLLSFVQKKYNMPVVSLSKKPQGFLGDFIQIEDSCAVGNYEFLHLFEKAEIVVTSSFHGTAYALNFGKPLLALENGKSKSDDRISSLLNSVDLSTQLIFTDTELSDVITPYYNVEDEQRKIDVLRNESLSFLNSSLKDW